MGLVMRVKGENFWSAHLGGRLLTRQTSLTASQCLGGLFPDSAINALHSRIQLRFAIDTEKQWQDRPHAKKMALVKV